MRWRGEQRLVVEKIDRAASRIKIFHPMIEVGFLRAVPAQFIALFGVVGTLMIGGLDA